MKNVIERWSTMSEKAWGYNDSIKSRITTKTRARGDPRYLAKKSKTRENQINGRAELWDNIAGK